MSSDIRQIDRRFSLQYFLEFYEFSDKLLIYFKANNDKNTMPSDMYDSLVVELLNSLKAENHDPKSVLRIKNALTRDMLILNKVLNYSESSTDGGNTVRFPTVLVEFLKYANNEARALVGNEYDAHTKTMKDYKIQIKQIHPDSKVDDKFKDLILAIQNKISNVEWDIETSVTSLDYDASNIVTNKYRTIEERTANFVKVNNIYSRNVEPLYRFTNTEGEFFSKEVKTILSHLAKFPLLKKYHDDIYHRFNSLMSQAHKVPRIRKQIYEYLQKEKEDLDLNHGLEVLRTELNTYIRKNSNEDLGRKHFNASDNDVVQHFNRYFHSGGFKTQRSGISTNDWTLGQLDEFGQYLAELEGKYSNRVRGENIKHSDVDENYLANKEIAEKRLLLDSMLIPKFRDYLFSDDNLNQILDSNKKDVTQHIITHLNDTYDGWIVGDFEYLCLYLITEFQSDHQAKGLLKSRFTRFETTCDYTTFYFTKKQEIAL